jgi:hypothetical protein
MQTAASEAESSLDELHAIVQTRAHNLLGRRWLARRRLRLDQPRSLEISAPAGARLHCEIKPRSAGTGLARSVHVICRVQLPGTAALHLPVQTYVGRHLDSPQLARLIQDALHAAQP